MVFSSLLFLFRFLPLVLFIYYIVLWIFGEKKELQNLVLFLASLIFYAWGEPVYVVLIIFSTFVDYFAGRTVARCKANGNQRGAKAAVFVSVVINLSLLGFFKYGDFFGQIFSHLTGIPVKKWNLSLPIGISFYTFQTMSYTIDVYRSDAKVQKNWLHFGTYVSLFPQLIAGPIIRFKDVAGQLEHRKEYVDTFFRGMLRFITGLGKKVLIANQVGKLWDQISVLGTGELTVASAWMGILAFTLQIYFDFSGYSDMAIGLGAMFGFDFPENFQYPYESKSITEFWRRWHISLGTWFREYVYIPLGGNRKGARRQILNLTVVWLLTGLWHGASMNFVLWGVYYGILLILEKIVLKPFLQKMPAVLAHLYTMFLVMIGWAIFSWQDMAQGAYYMRTLFFASDAALFDSQTLYLFHSYLLILLIAMTGSLSLLKHMTEKKFPEMQGRGEEMTKNLSWKTGAAAGVYLLAVFIACVAVLVNSSYNPFLYFRF